MSGSDYLQFCLPAEELEMIQKEIEWSAKYSTPNWLLTELAIYSKSTCKHILLKLSFEQNETQCELIHLAGSPYYLLSLLNLTSIIELNAL